MSEYTAAAIITAAAVIKTVSFGVWTIKRRNILGGVCTILLALTALILMSIHIFANI